MKVALLVCLLLFGCSGGETFNSQTGGFNEKEVIDAISHDIGLLNQVIQTMKAENISLKEENASLRTKLMQCQKEHALN